MENLSKKDKQKLRMLVVKDQLLGFGVRNYADHIKHIDPSLDRGLVENVYNTKQANPKVLAAFEKLLSNMQRLYSKQ